ncbi:MAG TPA: RNA polymerase subunit sigma-24 [Planctomycetes bacterium]|nr:RNA polymerase subunit sigma-24 [Planctomycetota bacterium]
MQVDTERPRGDAVLIAEEGALILRVLAGERDLFRALVERYERRVYAVALRILGDRHDAEDASQETFVRAFRSLDGFDARRAFVNWLLAIATNVARRHLQRRRRAMPIVQIDAICAGAAASEGEGEESAAALRGAVAECLERLSEPKRRALVLLHRDRRSYAEIAAIMDVPIGTVKTAIHRARVELREMLRARDLM